MTRFVKSPKDVATGLLLIVTAAFFAWQGADLPMGRAIKMGPGYFPMVLAGLLAFFGLIVLVGGLTSGAAQGEPINVRRWPWRALILVSVAVTVFGVGIRPFGLGPAMGLAVFISSLASHRFTFGSGVAMALVMVAFSWAVFIKGLGLPLPMLGPWLGGY
ncbi:tripartite tricarboxylate transporter TctB family protein [Ancylobacter pratisalsi]|uniref:Tripartite tricarboxylate transporter TctB family protein n=1 Tax=Ancylobacter pratisalsi TaxID=1745854 RepID=A0A6P1YUU7_9HYPH|nr:tripartite tricarboxylate transporter TctB family protein [Ancylobacter pratisalsi]QIB35384.1 tripartite tricarboxylate transporter TctB family protein [Ancylobacter pratisalsi]